MKPTPWRRLCINDRGSRISCVLGECPNSRRGVPGAGVPEGAAALHPPHLHRASSGVHVYPAAASVGRPAGLLRVSTRASPHSRVPSLAVVLVCSSVNSFFVFCSGEVSVSCLQGHALSLTNSTWQLLQHTTSAIKTWAQELLTQA